MPRFRYSSSPHAVLTRTLQLALKHRQNRQQRQRIIVFVGSPIAEDEKTLVKLAKKMKKNNVAIDFINFGELDTDNTTKLQAFVDTVNASDNSHLATIPPGPHLLSDQLVTTPILSDTSASSGGGEGAGSGPGEGPGGFDFGVDPSLDPELALALRMSMEEEKARLAKEQKEKDEKEGKSGEASGSLEGIKEEDEGTPLLKKDDGGEGASGSKDDDKMDIA